MYFSKNNENALRIDELKKRVFIIKIKREGVYKLYNQKTFYNRETIAALNHEHRKYLSYPLPFYFKSNN